MNTMEAYKFLTDLINSHDSGNGEIHEAASSHSFNNLNQMPKENCNSTSTCQNYSTEFFNAADEFNQLYQVAVFINEKITSLTDRLNQIIVDDINNGACADICSLRTIKSIQVFINDLLHNLSCSYKTMTVHNVDLKTVCNPHEQSQPPCTRSPDKLTTQTTTVTDKITSTSTVTHFCTVTTCSTIFSDSSSQSSQCENKRCISNSHDASSTTEKKITAKMIINEMKRALLFGEDDSLKAVLKRLEYSESD